jgi:hypothetical protein
VEGVDFPTASVAGMIFYDACARYRITSRAGNLWSIMPKRTQARNKPSWNEERATWNSETIAHRVIINIYHYSSIPRQRRVDFPADLPGQQIDGGELTPKIILPRPSSFTKKATSNVLWVRWVGIKCTLPS